METMRPLRPANFPAFDRTAQDPLVDESGQPNFTAIQNTVEFRRIRRRLALFTIPMSVLFFCWYMLYVLLAAYAHDFMSQPVSGKITVGLLLGLSQFVSTIVIMLVYLRFARKRIDPHTDALRARVDASQSDRARALASTASNGRR